MIISYKNIREIENINLHDAYIENVIYNHSNKVINVELESEWEKTCAKTPPQNISPML